MSIFQMGFLEEIATLNRSYLTSRCHCLAVDVLQHKLTTTHQHRLNDKSELIWDTLVQIKDLSQQSAGTELWGKQKVARSEPTQPASCFVKRPDPYLNIMF